MGFNVFLIGPDFILDWILYDFIRVQHVFMLWIANGILMGRKERDFMGYGIWMGPATVNVIA